MSGYRGRFAPSPTGPLHRGSLVAALASWLDARANHGKWLIRIEDIDPPRESAGAARRQLAMLEALGLQPDEPVILQSTRTAAYAAALAQLRAAGRVYPCSCTRSRLAADENRKPPRAAAPDSAAERRSGVYPGTCRGGAVPGLPAAWRVRVADVIVGTDDRARGLFQQNLEGEVGDFVLQRADGCYAYQLAVVVDDAFQRVTDVVRGADLLDNTPRQIYLQRLLGLPTPRYLHVPLVLDPQGNKLSKQTGAQALDPQQPLAELERAWQHLGFAPTGARSVDGFQRRAVQAWARRYGHVD